MSNQQPVSKTNFEILKLWSRGKVRDIYEVDGELLIFTTDRISAFDVEMDDPIPGKGRILNSVTNFWFRKFYDIVDNHVIATDPNDFPNTCKPYIKDLAGRSIFAKKVRPLPIECISRGYISGSGWKEYLNDGTICGIPLPKGLSESEELPEPIFTPSTKASHGLHDENITFTHAVELVGEEVAEEVKRLSLLLYQYGRAHAKKAGIIIADTKFEFGLDDTDKIILIDEVLTPDSSRFWPIDTYSPGGPQQSFDKQFLRDYLNDLVKAGEWNKEPPPPKLPQDIITKTKKKYLEAEKLILGL